MSFLLLQAIVGTHTPLFLLGVYLAPLHKKLLAALIFWGLGVLSIAAHKVRHPNLLDLQVNTSFWNKSGASFCIAVAALSTSFCRKCLRQVSDIPFLVVYGLTKTRPWAFRLHTLGTRANGINQRWSFGCLSALCLTNVPVAVYMSRWHNAGPIAALEFLRPRIEW